MTLADLSPVASVVALIVSLFTLWFSVLRRGTVRSTHPSFIALRYDFVGKKVPQAKIFFRALLFSTGKRGQVVESLFLRVREGARQAEFSFWGHGDKDLIRGSGLFVRRLVGFLAGLYNGSDYPFALTELRGLDTELANACLDYLNYDRPGHREVHKHLAHGEQDLQRWLARYGLEPRTQS